MKITFLPPRKLYTGNLLWQKGNAVAHQPQISDSLAALRKLGYWASPYPEGDGVTFKENTECKSADVMLTEISSCFSWAQVKHAESQDANEELAKLEDNATLQCIVIVPLNKIFIEETFALGKYTFFCKKELDSEPNERLGTFDTEYLQFETNLNYSDLLKANKTIPHDNIVIEKCLSLAEHALDIIRFQVSSFKKIEFTPNPAGQLESGFFAVEIIPNESTHLKPMMLGGISRPMSVSNNWLGPHVSSCDMEGLESFIDTPDAENNELAIAVKCVLRSCRQSFYSLGSESRFLNLVFALDGLVSPDSNWTGWKHRTYIAALLSDKDVAVFKEKLVHYDELYTDIRNKLVHGGLDFYQLSANPDDACESIYQYIKNIIVLINKEGFNAVKNLKDYATTLLQSQPFITGYIDVIKSIQTTRDKTQHLPKW